MKRKILRRHPVVLKETRNRAHMNFKVSVTIELEFILSLIGKFHSNRSCILEVVVNKSVK